MKKHFDLSKRIAFYTGKVALLGNRSTDKGKNKYRNQRLLNYKQALASIIEQVRGKH